MEKIIIATAFHDIGIWTAHTVDYLTPSEKMALDYLVKNGQENWSEEISQMIQEHHNIRSVALTKVSPLVDAFRRADWVDFSHGVVGMGIPRSVIRTVQKAFPNEGFHVMLVKSALAWFKEHPLTIPPFIKY